MRPEGLGALCEEFLNSQGRLKQRGRPFFCPAGAFPSIDQQDDLAGIGYSGVSHANHLSARAFYLQAKSILI